MFCLFIFAVFFLLIGFKTKAQNCDNNINKLYYFIKIKILKNKYLFLKI